ncbi:unnamed protein product, partial [Auanema sp. JU1783]
DHNILLCNKTVNQSGTEIKNKKIFKPKQQQLLTVDQSCSRNNQEEEANNYQGDSSDDSGPIMLNNVDQVHETEKIILKTAEIKAYNHKRNRFENINVIIDEGSMRSLITEDYAKKLGLPIKGATTKTFYGIGGMKDTHPVKEVSIVLKSKKGKVELLLNTKPCITVAVSAPILKNGDRRYIKANNIQLANTKMNGEQFQPHLLIGMDCYKEIADIDTNERVLPSGLLVRNTLFGGVVYGVIPNEVKTKNVSLFVFYNDESRELTPAEIANKLFSIDNLGIDFQEEEKAEITMQYYEEYSLGIVIKNKRITAPFPVTDKISLLQDNKKVAMKRIHCLRMQLEKNPDQNRWYNQIMGDYIKNGIVEKVPNTDNA